MSDVTYAVQFSTMSDAISDAQRRAVQIQNLLEQMDKSSRGHLSTWTGDAQRAYEEAYATCRQQAARMPATLTAARQALGSIMQQYQDTESNVTKSFS